MENKFNEREYKILKDVKRRVHKAYIKEKLDESLEIFKKVYAKIRLMNIARKEKQSTRGERV